MSKDIHTAKASEIFGVPESQVTPDMRNIAKTVNFPHIYGSSLPTMDELSHRYSNIMKKRSRPRRFFSSIWKLMTHAFHPFCVLYNKDDIERRKRQIGRNNDDHRSRPRP